MYDFFRFKQVIQNFKTEQMKKAIFIIIIIFFSNSIVAQSVNDLDIKNGFRHLKLGSTPSQIKNIVKQENQFSKNPHVVAYYYVGSDIDNIFNVKVDEIKLSFFKNKLFNISITFGNLEESKDFEVYEFNDILSALERTYGTNWVKPKNDEGIFLNGAIWDGKNVRLELFRLDFSKSKTNPKDYGFVGGYINVFDKKLTKEMFSSDF